MEQYNLFDTLFEEQQQMDLDKQILILVIIHSLIGKVKNLTLQKSHIIWLLKHFNPYNAINLALILQVLIDFCCHSDQNLNTIIESFEELKELGKFRYVTEPIFKALEVQNNLYVIRDLCTFVNSFFGDDEISDFIQQQIEQNELTVLYDNIKLKLKNDEYKISQSNYQFAKKFLQDEKFKLHSSNLDNFYMKNLMDFDPNKPPLLQYVVFQDIFNTDEDHFQNEKQQLQTQLLVYDQFIKPKEIQQQTFQQKENYQGRQEELKSLWQTQKTESQNQEQIIDAISDANTLEEIKDLLVKLNNKSPEETVLSRLVNTLANKIGEIIEKQNNQQKVKQEGNTQQTVFLQQKGQQESKNLKEQLYQKFKMQSQSQQEQGADKKTQNKDPK